MNTCDIALYTPTFNIHVMLHHIHLASIHMLLSPTMLLTVQCKLQLYHGANKHDNFQTIYDV